MVIFINNILITSVFMVYYTNLQIMLYNVKLYKENSKLTSMGVTNYKVLGILLGIFGAFWCLRGGFLVGQSAFDGKILEMIANIAYCLMGGIVCSIAGLVSSWDKEKISK